MPRSKQMGAVVKGQIIALSQQKLSVRQIAAKVGFSKSSVADFFKEICRNGFNGAKARIWTTKNDVPAEDRMIKRMCIQDRFKSSADIRKEFLDATGVEIDSSTVRRRLINAGFVGRHPAKKPFLNEKMRQKRYRWAKTHENWTVEHWKNVIFSDESKFNLFGSDGIHHVRRRSGERYKTGCILPTVRQSVGRMVWVCLSYDGTKTLTLIDGRVNGDAYISILNRHLIPVIEEQYSLRTDVIFQDGSAPCHRSHKVKEFMEKNGIVQ
ncbi:transposable element Tcb2 transposase [Anastrepha obliqua]|uniref:transposable element Tcb2 transposase n=1 Tax=Anastrepha obliqua TaxID=95512 RepID=UPI00240A5B79|nr:transposable element Tcb2 transposase [Anastrepha obliqua]XP_054745607.1 transposable element Tcb2 transposase [Anastrepha obliqua]